VEGGGRYGDCGWEVEVVEAIGEYWSAAIVPGPQDRLSGASDMKRRREGEGGKTLPGRRRMGKVIAAPILWFLGGFLARSYSGGRLVFPVSIFVYPVCCEAGLQEMTAVR